MDGGAHRYVISLLILPVFKLSLLTPFPLRLPTCFTHRILQRLSRRIKVSADLNVNDVEPIQHAIQRPEPPPILVPLRDRCSFGRFTWVISQALTVTYVVGEHRLYLERNCRLPESGPQETAESRGACQFQGAEQSARVRTSGRTSAKVEAAFHGFHGSSPCKCQRLSTLRGDRLPPSRSPTKSWARAGGRRLSDRRLQRWLAGTSTSAASSHGAADLLGLNRAHICVRNPNSFDSFLGLFIQACGCRCFSQSETLGR